MEQIIRRLMFVGTRLQIVAVQFEYWQRVSRLQRLQMHVDRIRVGWVFAALRGQRVIGGLPERIGIVGRLWCRRWCENLIVVAVLDIVEYSMLWNV